MKSRLLLAKTTLILLMPYTSWAEQGAQSFDGKIDPVWSLISDRHPPSVAEWYQWPSVKSMTSEELLRRFVYWIEQPENPKGEKNGVFAAYAASLALQSCGDDPLLEKTLLEALRNSESAYINGGVLRGKIAYYAGRYLENENFISQLKDELADDQNASMTLLEGIKKREATSRPSERKSENQGDSVETADDSRSFTSTWLWVGGAAVILAVLFYTALRKKKSAGG